MGLATPVRQQEVAHAEAGGSSSHASTLRGERTAPRVHSRLFPSSDHHVPMAMNGHMRVTARRATDGDLPELLRMYASLEAEQAAIREIWPHADGLDVPIDGSLTSLIHDDRATGIVGEIDGAPVGFLFAVEEPLLRPLTDRYIGVVRFIFTDDEARGVGVGAAMLVAAMERLEERGIDLFDARVSPGHRLAKNFFESNGFKARSITMHRSDAGSIAPASGSDSSTGGAA
jgi:GNAT superfamily N-acetyltransferase